MNPGAIRFYKKLNEKGFKPNEMCEVGVYLPEESNILYFLKDKINATLIEANPFYFEKIKEYFQDYPNVKIINVAVNDYHGETELIRHQSSSFLKDLVKTPALVNDNFKGNDTITIKSMLFSEIDEGNFDLLSIDIEGADWFVLKHLKSNPKVISIETHGKYYVNPYLDEIKSWMKTKNYILWYKDESDSVYIKDNLFDITFSERMGLILKSISLYLKSLKKIFKYHKKNDI